MTINRKFKLSRKNMLGGGDNYVFVTSNGNAIDIEQQRALLESFSRKNTSKKSSKNTSKSSKNTSKKLSNTSKFNAREYSVKSRRKSSSENAAASASAANNLDLALALSQISVSDSNKSLPPATGNDPTIDGYYENSYFLAEENIPNGDCAYYTIARGVDLLLNNIYGGNPVSNKIPGKKYVDISKNNPHLWGNKNTGSYYRFHYHFVTSKFRNHLKELLNEKVHEYKLGDKIFGLRNRAQRGANNIIKNNHAKTGTFADSFQLGAMSCIFKINLCVCQVSQEGSVLNKTWILFEPTECLVALLNDKEPGRILEIIIGINPKSKNNIGSSILMGLNKEEENYMVASEAFKTNPTLFIWNSDNGHYKLMIPKMISAQKQFSLFTEYHKNSSTVIPKWGIDIRNDARSSKNLSNLLVLFSENGIENGRRAENYDRIVKSIPRRLSFEDVDLIRQQLDVDKIEPDIIIDLFNNTYGKVRSNSRSRSRSRYNSRSRSRSRSNSRSRSRSKAGPTKDDSWKDVARLIQHTLKKKLSQKELIFIRDEITINKTPPDFLYESFVSGGKKSTSVAKAAEAAPAPKKPPSQKKSMKINFKTKSVKSKKNVNSLREDMLREFKEQKPFISDLYIPIPDKDIYDTLKRTNYDFDEAANLLLQSM